MSKESLKERPRVITILIILYILALVLSFALIAIYGSEFLPSSAISASLIVGLSGLLTLVLLYGLWNGKSWAWSLLMIFSLLSLLSIIGLDLRIVFELTSRNALGPWGSGNRIKPIEIFTAFIDSIFLAAFLFVLTRPQVKSFFGKRTLF
jgi:hypothetical protein